ncbi:MAG: hypothetical protein Harvfovirus2_76 [Harvfovirus sp.]|uniref:Uncharacterized protein n=1 Tax=Harvfovirus sp. TaxID=2487768 RepID=A0A3G4ZZY5_9VIRU|nr:MAG: hypothetical protein Harvfovirus2_76 [Harvfovirus sp.]
MSRIRRAIPTVPTKAAISTFKSISEPDNVNEAGCFHEKRLVELSQMKDSGFNSISKFNAYSESKAVIALVELCSTAEHKIPEPYIIPDEPDSISEAKIFHEARLGQLRLILISGISSISFFKKYIESKALVKRIDEEHATIKAEEKRQLEAKIAEEERKHLEEAKRLRAIQEKTILETKRVADLLNEFKPYVERCLREKDRVTLIDFDHRIFKEEKYLREYITQIHTEHNESLLEGTVHKGCGWKGWEKDCKWTYGEYRCSCGNYKGFRWNTTDVDWLNLKIFSIDSTEPVGFQEKMWPI